MSDTLNLINKVEPCIIIPASTSVAEALTKLAGVSFALIGSTSHPQRLVQKEYLQALTDKESQPLAEVLEHFPLPIAITKETVIELDVVDLKLVIRLLQTTKASDLVVYDNYQAIGVISRKTIRAALPPSAIFSTAKRNDLPGNPVTRAQCYICQECKREGQAQYIFSPDQGSDIMNCPLDPLHGPMERYNG